MSDLTWIKDFEAKIKPSSYVPVSREVLTEVTMDLRAAAIHLETVGWTKFKNFTDFTKPATSPCCAVGALHAIGLVGARVMVGRLTHATWVFERLTGTSLVHFNDYVAENATEVVSAMRNVADEIDKYLAATGD